VIAFKWRVPEHLAWKEETSKLLNAYVRTILASGS
jgi:hypothetical protein